MPKIVSKQTLDQSDIVQRSEICIGVIDGQHKRGVDGVAKPQGFKLFDRRNDAAEADFGLQELRQEVWTRIERLRNTFVDGGKIRGVHRTGWKKLRACKKWQLRHVTTKMKSETNQQSRDASTDDGTKCVAEN